MGKKLESRRWLDERQTVTFEWRLLRLSFMKSSNQKEMGFSGHGRSLNDVQRGIE